MAAFPSAPFVIPPLAPLAVALLAGSSELWRPRGLRRENEQLREENRLLQQENRRLRSAAEASEAPETSEAVRSAGDPAAAHARALADTSHELRTPLNGILGMAELLAGTGLDPEQDSYVAAIRSAGTALAALVDGILELARIEAGKAGLGGDGSSGDELGEVANEPYDPLRLVESVTELLAPAAQAKGLEIAAHVAADVPERVGGDAAKLRQVLLNLIGNAVKFTGAGGVGVRVGIDGGSLVVAVEDTGPGVPPDRRAAIFEDYARDHAAAGGTGLGLAISRRLAERMGGTLAVDGREGGGACFTLTLPLPEEHPAQEAPAGSRGSRNLRSLRRLRVLIAAPAAASPFQAPFLARQLAQAGADVTALADPEAARVALLTQAPFDAVLVDCGLGDAALASLAAAARSSGAARTAVMFSPSERRAFGPAAGRGFDGWLVKPVRRQTLLALVGSRLLGATPADPELAPNLADPRLAESIWGGPPSAGPAYVPGRLAVLLAEDDEVSALLALRHLARLGATVTHAPDGLAALALAETAMAEGRPFTAAVLDLRMPGLGGLEVAHRLRLAEAARGLSPCRITVLSGDTEQFAQAGPDIDAVVAKPVTFARLADALRPAVEVAGAA